MLGASLVCSFAVWLALFGPRRYLTRLLGTSAFVGLRLRGSLRLAPLAGLRPVILIGDSRIEGIHPSSIESPGTLVTNAGISGSTAHQWRAMFGTFPTGERTSVFVVWAGINDLLYLQSTPRMVAAEMQRLVSCILAMRRSRVVVIEQIPVHVSPNSYDSMLNQSIAELNQQLGVLASRSPRIALMELHARLSTPGARALYSDGLHLNERGNALIARLVRAAL